MKKSLLLFLLATLAAIGPARAVESLTVNDGTGENTNIPIYGFYGDEYQKTAFIIPAQNLTEMNDGLIFSLAWYLSSPGSSPLMGTFQIVLSEVEGTTVTNFSEADAGTVVYEGLIDVTKSVTQIEFDNPYHYQGGNLLVGVRVITPSNFTSITFSGTQAQENVSAYGHSGNSLDAINANASKFLPKTTLYYTPPGETYISKPKNLTVSDIHTNSATVSWTAGSNETSWNIAYKETAEEQWNEELVNNTTYLLDELQNGTYYDVRVQAVTSDGQSEWVTIQFATPYCDDSDKVAVNYTLSDTYGDGWNGNKIQVVNEDTGIAEYTLECPSSTIDGTIMLCVGVTYNFVWVKGSYSDEASFVFSDENGEIFNCTSASDYNNGDIIFSYTPQFTLYSRPKDVAASNVTYSTADLSWTPGSDESAWQIVYAEGADFDPDGIDMIPIEVTGTPSTTLTGLSEDATYYVYVRGNFGEGNLSLWSDVCSFTTPERFNKPTDLTIDDVKATSVTAHWTGDAQSYNVRYRAFSGIYESFEDGVIPNGWTIVDSDEDGRNWKVINPSTYFTPSEINAYDGQYTIMSRSYDGSAFTPDNWLITSKVELGGELEYWIFGDEQYPETYRIYVSTTDTDISSFVPLTDNLESPRESGWFYKSFSLSDFAGQEGYIAFRHYDCYNMDLMLIDAVKVKGTTEQEWTMVENATNPVTITGLDPSTIYEIQVQSIYSDGASKWTESKLFTTPDITSIPEIVNVETTANNATVSWTGANDTYNLRYRTSVKKVGFFDDFESNSLSGWTNLDADGDNNGWYIFSPFDIGINTVDANGNPYTLDFRCATSASYNGSALNPDNWLISPQVELKGEFSVWLRNQDTGYPETFAIYLSTTGKNVEDFTTVLVAETQAPALYSEYTADLSEYNGAKGYIAIRHFNSSDKFRLNVDNFHVKHGEDIPAGEWIVMENVSSPFVIEGLDPDTRYDVEIQGVIDDDNVTEWTPVKWFETEKGPITLAKALVGKEGDVTISSNLKVVEANEIFASASDGEGNWIVLFTAEPLDEGIVIANLQGIISGLDKNPSMTVESYDVSEAIVDVAEASFDLRTAQASDITALKSAEIVSFIGCYNATSQEICAYEPDDDPAGIHLTAFTDYISESAIENKLQKFTGLIQFAEAWDAPARHNGVPARVPIDGDNAIENILFYITDVEALTPTGIDNVAVTGSKQIQGIYNVNGQRVTRPEKGIYIIRYTDGSAAKVRF